MGRLFLAGVVAALVVFPARGSSFDDFNQGVNAHNRGDNSAAIVALSRALASGDLPASMKPAALLDRGIAFEHEKRYEDAIADLTAALVLSPGSYDATYWRMLALEGNGQEQQAGADCDALIKWRPRMAPLYMQCGMIRWENGEFANAVPYFETSAGLGDKPATYSVLWLEIARLRAGKPDEGKFVQLSKELNLNDWPSPLFDLYLGKIAPEAAIAASEKIDSRAGKPVSLEVRQCESAFFVGEWHLLQNHLAIARSLLRHASDICNSSAVDVEFERLPKQ